MTTVSKFFALTIVLLAFTTASFATTFHAVIITDPDQNIGSTKDVILYKDLVDRIGEITTMEVDKKVFDKNDSGIVEYIRNLNPAADDVVWVMYSGHGRNSGNGWPLFTANNLNYLMTDIRGVLNQKNCRLKIVTYDSCNIGVTDEQWTDRIRTTPAAWGILFKSTRGTIMATAASPGQYGYGNPELGGFFTTSLIKSLNEVSPTDGTNLWRVVLEKTKESANAMCQQVGRRIQNPIYHLDIEGDDIGSENHIPAPEPINRHATKAFGN